MPDTTPEGIPIAALTLRVPKTLSGVVVVYDAGETYGVEWLGVVAGIPIPKAELAHLLRCMADHLDELVAAEPDR